jgi:hypothetical protein
MLVKRTRAVHKVVRKLDHLVVSVLIRVQALVCAVFAAAHCGGEPFGLEKRSVVAIESEVTLAFCMISGLSINANIARAMPR